MFSPNSLPRFSVFDFSQEYLASIVNFTFEPCFFSVGKSSSGCPVEALQAIWLWIILIFDRMWKFPSDSFELNTRNNYTRGKLERTQIWFRSKTVDTNVWHENLNWIESYIKQQITCFCFLVIDTQNGLLVDQIRKSMLWFLTVSLFY